MKVKRYTCINGVFACNELCECYDSTQLIN